MLTIHLGQDENDCFSAWVSAKETGLAENDAVDQKGNDSFTVLKISDTSELKRNRDEDLIMFSLCFSELW